MPNSTIQKLLEQFNRENPCGDSYELAKFFFERGRESLKSCKDTEDDPEPLRINPPGKEELAYIRLNPCSTPVAYATKVRELVEQCGLSEKDANVLVRNTDFALELYYEKGFGLFAVESEACESPGLVSPYTGRELVQPEEGTTSFVSADEDKPLAYCVINTQNYDGGTGVTVVNAERPEDLSSVGLDGDDIRKADALPVGGTMECEWPAAGAVILVKIKDNRINDN